MSQAPLDPMRPVRLAPDEWPSTPAWKMPALIAVSAVAAVSTLALPNTAARVTVAAVALIVAVVLAVASTRRTVRESGDQRISWLRGPAVRRRDVDLLHGCSGSALFVGALALNSVPGWYWWVTAALVVWVLPTLVLQARHNRRVARSGADSVAHRRFLHRI
ncbi:MULTISPECIES: hypothetical protein [Nocardiaceae]|uniref:Membrane protein implicated in regulation of membrane protease activity n=1 Tax=Rhodococcoides corynebacterioides TaxID=53972 RepID=A0ABS2KSB1_9NOCA|nr:MULTISPECIES: hypothetical protein [Rhodococcus]MBM7414833.1 membrane protein implicated in regulation of membrane protease activity [Rhodococcus corynebacterioides]MBP1117295.1 membrane protein implicated in regulation of membrane protease activity [Rhodococcus sp. PvP016]